MKRKARLSPRLLAVVDALPLFPGMRVLEIGCGTGAAAREVSRRIGSGHILGIDRSEKAIRQALASSREEIAAGRLSFRHRAIETFEPEADEKPFDLVFAVRVGALDGRHPEAGKKALQQIAKVLKPGGRVFIDGGEVIKELPGNPNTKAKNSPYTR